MIITHLGCVIVMGATILAMAVLIEAGFYLVEVLPTTRCWKYLTYREPYIHRGLPFRYYSIGACILFVGAVATLAVGCASFVAFVLYTPK